VVFSDYGKGGLTHIAEMIGWLALPAKVCWSIRRATTIRLLRRGDDHHAESLGVARSRRSLEG
jgi:hypothetical protein